MSDGSNTVKDDYGRIPRQLHNASILQNEALVNMTEFNGQYCFQRCAETGLSTILPS